MAFLRECFPKLFSQGMHNTLSLTYKSLLQAQLCVSIQTLEHIETPYLIQLVQFYVQMRLQTQVKHQQGHDGFPLPFSHLIWTSQTLEQSQQD